MSAPGVSLWRSHPLGLALAGLLLIKSTATFLTLVINSAVYVAWGTGVGPLQTAALAVGFCAALGLLVRYMRNVNVPLSWA